jgi:membrane fusion protein, multidrug efflux system
MIRPASPHRWRLRLLIAVVASALASVILPRLLQEQSTRAAPERPSVRGIPVVAATAQTGDMAVYLTGLGTATALKTVTVQSRVDGELIDVAYREGQLVHAGDLLAELDPRPFQVQLAQAEGQAAKDEAALENARVDLERYRVLVEQDSAPRQQLDSQAAMVHQLEGTLASDQAQIQSAKLNLTYSKITAPIGGRVGLRLVDRGNMIHAADQKGLVVITELQPIALLFTIPEDSLPQVLPQIRAGRRLHVEAYDRDLKKKIADGSLLSVDNEIDQTTGTVRLKAEFPNRDDALFPNQFVNARLVVETIHGAVIVPSAAIQRSPQATFVYVVKPDNTVETRSVTVQHTEGDKTAIARGVNAGERVVTDGVDKLQQGGPVDVQRPGPDRAASAGS